VLVDLLRRGAVADPAATAAAMWGALHGVAQLWQWGRLQVATGTTDPEPILIATVGSAILLVILHLISSARRT
jgi:uncharacterized membrane protein YeaQ/YmgE (transglycosylase-associated protein family)